MWCDQARLPEIEELQKEIKASGEELVDLQYKHKTESEAAAARELALNELVAKLQKEVMQATMQTS